MSTQLVYHRPSDKVSPFDKCAIKIASDSDLSIACPYIAVNYVRRLIKVSNSWRLVTDIDEWLKSSVSAERKKIPGFVKANMKVIRHAPGLHAKVLIGRKSALIGSANLTRNGIQSRIEMGAFFRDNELRTQLNKWFNDLWKNSFEIPVDKLNVIVDTLPEPFLPTPRLMPEGKRRLAPLVDIEIRDEISRVSSNAPTLQPAASGLAAKVLTYKNARGYKTVRNGFRVLADSCATARHT